MRKITTFGLSVAVLAATGWLAQASAQSAGQDTSAPAATDSSSAPAASDSSGAAPADSAAPAPKKAHHAHHHKAGGNTNGVRGDAAVEDLNAQSLDAAKSGKSFSPPTSLPADKAAAKPAKADKAAPKHHSHHHAAKPAASSDTSGTSGGGDTSSSTPDAGK